MLIIFSKIDLTLHLEQIYQQQKAPFTFFLTSYILYHKRATYTIQDPLGGPGELGVSVSMCVFTWVSASMHAWAMLRRWGDRWRQGSQLDSSGLSQLISSRARPQTGQQPSPGSSCETAAGEYLSLTLQIERGSESDLTLSDLTPAHTPLVTLGFNWCCMWMLISSAHAHRGVQSAYKHKPLTWLPVRPAWGQHQL